MYSGLHIIKLSSFALADLALHLAKLNLGDQSLMVALDLFALVGEDSGIKAVPQHNLYRSGTPFLAAPGGDAFHVHHVRDLVEA